MDLAEIHFSDTAQTEAENGLLRKVILRTGTYPEIPTKGGIVKKPLKIIRTGPSDKDEGTISLEEVKQNFDLKAIGKVQIPLSDDTDDHKNITKLNTGFVEGLEIEEDDEGESLLVAKMNFTEPDVREKVLRGTYADVSCGIPWEIKSRGQKYGSTLEHVAITNRPYLPDLGPFLAASDQPTEEVEISHFATDDEMEEALREILDEVETPPPPAPPVDPPAPQEPAPPPPPKQPGISAEEKKQALSASLAQNGILTGYSVTDFTNNTATIWDKNHSLYWIAPYTTGTSGNTFTIFPPAQWAPKESAEEAEEPPVREAMSELEHARRLRGLRLSQGNSNTTPEVNMPLSREELDRLELSDEQKGYLSELLDENATLRASQRENDVENRLTELKGLGLEERPGALKLYRTVALSDDGAPAAVLLSDNGQKESVSALEILDRFIEAIKGVDGKVQLSDQNLVRTDDEKPPVDAEGEVIPFEDRLAAAKQALGNK